MDAQEPTLAKRSLFGGAGLIAVTLCYVLSYAPMYRLLRGADSPPLNMMGSFRPGAFDAKPWESAYTPVMWMTDNTPLNRPLQSWARLWNVADSLETDSVIRQLEPLIDEMVADLVLEVSEPESDSGTQTKEDEYQ